MKLLFVSACCMMALIGCSRAATTNLAGQSVGSIVTNMVAHAQSGDASYFAPVLDSTSAGHVSELLPMIQRSGMLTNYTSRLKSQSAVAATLDYHDLKRGCHFQVELQNDGGTWKVTRIWLCR